MFKYISAVIIFLTFSFLTFLSQENQNEQSQKSKDKVYEKQIAPTIFEKNENYKRTKYLFNVDINDSSKTAEVFETIIWYNNSNDIVENLLINLNANAYSNSKNFPDKDFNQNNKTKYQILKIECNNSPAEIKYLESTHNFEFDSTLAKIDLVNSLNSSDSVIIKIHYKLKIPLATNGLGFSNNGEFFLMKDWFPKVASYINGNWNYSHANKYNAHYSNFSDYKLSLRISKDYTVGTAGSIKPYADDSIKNNYNIEFQNAKDFAWFASKDVYKYSEEILLNSGKMITANLFIQTNRERYFDRYKTGLINSLHYLDSLIGDYKFDNITLIDLPRTFNNSNLFMTNIIPVSTSLISPIALSEPEWQIANHISRQYTEADIAASYQSNKWVEKGVATYLADKIICNFYGNRVDKFQVAGYYPIYGMNYLSYNEIPLIYTLGNYSVDLKTKDLSSYYNQLNQSRINDSLKNYINSNSYDVATSVKPALVLHSLENLYGEAIINQAIKNYHNSYKNDYTNSNSFVKKLQESVNENIDWINDDVLNSSHVYDYSVSEIDQVSEKKYKVIVKRNRAGIFKTDIALIIEGDTLIHKWDGKSEWKEVVFETDRKVIAAEVDPYKNNLLDINFSNNSRTLEARSWGSISIAIRWFFWIQNALMVMGSIG